MKTYLYYSESNKAVEAVVAYNRTQADEILLGILDATCVIIKDDYILMTTISLSFRSTGGFNIPQES